MQTQKYEVAATEKQLRFIQNLQKRGFVDGEINSNLTRREASQIIDAGLAEAKRKALQEEEHDETRESQSQQRNGIDPIRFGLCVKLVYNRQGYEMANANGVDCFKKEVRQLYQIIADLERDF